jgi:hypothetical protein
MKQRLGGTETEEVQSGRSEDTGGEPDAGAPDQHSTTGTTPNDELVGRGAGTDAGAGETTGSERRAAAEGKSSTDEQGANRDV